MSHGRTEHIFQLFDTVDSVGNVVSAFLAEGWDQGSSLLVIARDAHWKRIAARLERRGCCVGAAESAGRLHRFDAALTLAKITRAHAIDARLFEEHVTIPVMRVAQRSGTPLRVYGEMVELLAEEGNFAAAAQLEHLWNGLRDRVSFHLLCGYSAAHFAAPTCRDALRQLCDAHTCVRANTSDLLGRYVVKQA